MNAQTLFLIFISGWIGCSLKAETPETRLRSEDLQGKTVDELAEVREPTSDPSPADEKTEKVLRQTLQKVLKQKKETQEALKEIEKEM